METAIWGALLRVAQAFVQAMPTVLVGLIVAGVLRRLLGHAGTRKLFGDNTWRSLPQAWLIGMLLPVCSLGVIPVVRELRRAGVSGGAILAFGLTAPLFNPISVLYGLTLAAPVVIVTFSFCSLVIVTAVGLGWDKLFPGSAKPEPEPKTVALGAKRMLSIVVFAAREIAGPCSLYIAVGLLGVALLSLMLPHGYLQNAAEHDNPWAPLFMTSVAIPIYATPMTAMVQLASMFQHGNSVGAAFALLALGAGANLGLVLWMIREFGVRRSVVWFTFLVLVVVGLSYGVDKPLYPHGVEPIGHTHAFDIYCAPFHAGTSNPMSRAWHTLTEKIAVHEIAAVSISCILLISGFALARYDTDGWIEKWLVLQPAKKPKFDVVLPGWVLGSTALIGLVALSIVGCYVYYPPPNEIFEEMQLVNTEVASSARIPDWDTAQYWIPIYDDWTRKLQVSMFLRGKELTPFRRAKANVLREKLDLLEHAVEDQDVEKSRELSLAIIDAYQRMKAAYKEPSK